MSDSAKLKLYELCQLYVEQKITSIANSIDEAQNAANSETKSTAGDKHDTARAMMQLEVEQKSKQLAEAEKLKMTLALFSADSKHNTVKLGSFVRTSAATYYISISAGKLELGNETIFAISAASPIARAMMDKKTGESFSFNGKGFEIISVA
jgi:transcription elongation GreA/GreB family factor